MGTLLWYMQYKAVPCLSVSYTILPTHYSFSYLTQNKTGSGKVSMRVNSKVSMHVTIRLQLARDT